MAEKAIESAINGGKADIGDNSVTINTNAGTWTSGDAVSLPEGFPSDIYVIDGTIKTAMALAENEGYALSIYTDKSVAEVQNEYKNKLTEEGWTITLTMSYSSDSASLSAEKNNRAVTVSMYY